MNNVEEKKNYHKVSKLEIFWIVIEGGFGLAGFVMLILGLISDYLPVVYSENSIAQAEQGWMNFVHCSMSFRALGVILILIGAVIAVISLNHYAKKSDADEERAIRRAQRLQVLNATDSGAGVTESKEVVAEPTKDASSTAPAINN